MQIDRAGGRARRRLAREHAGQARWVPWAGARARAGALSLGLSNFAAAVGIGVAGIDARTRVRVGIVFGIFETGMPILGLALGHSLASTLGHLQTGDTDDHPGR